jgi:hypothetical protein
MTHLLLLGAGFSRNWGGWLASEVFEYLLGCQEIAAHPMLRAALWRHQHSGGFESALEEIQAEFAKDPSVKPQLDALQQAVLTMFEDMNWAFHNVQFEFQTFKERMVAYFLSRFDAIFSLNQDLLLEAHYLNQDSPALFNPGRWHGAQLPGMHRPSYVHDSGWGGFWAPLPEDKYVVHDRMQPFYKLHGSSNWYKAGSPLLVMGGRKTHAIRQHPVLQRYAADFEASLLKPETRLMVIGYGFRDAHINETLIRACDAGLKLFIVAPEGGDIARLVSPTAYAPIKGLPTPLEEAFKKSLIGASRRPLRDTFKRDAAEFNKIERFFEK